MAVTPIADRPLPLMDLLDGAFAALRQRPRNLVGVVAALVVPISILRGFLSRNLFGGISLRDALNDPVLAQELSNQSSFGSETLIDYGFDWAVVALAGVGVSRIVAGWLSGDDIGALDAMVFMARRSGVVAVAFVLNHLAQLLGAVLLLLPGLAVVVLFSLTSPVIAVEGCGPVVALRRSAALVRRSPGRVLGTVLLTGVVGYGVDNAVGLVPVLFTVFVGADKAWPILAAVEILSSLILVPFTTATMCLLYLDLRFRTEGLDLEIRARTTLGERS